MSKKKIIAIITVIVLLLAAGISVGVFFRGRGESEAADGSQTTVTDPNQVTDGNQSTDGTQTGENDENPTTNPDAGDENVGEAGDNETVDNENENNNAVDNNNAGNAGVTTDTNVNNIGETTITRVEEQEKIVSKQFLDWWQPMSVNVDAETVLGVKVPQLEVKKGAITNVGGDEFVFAGQNITYVITVTNNSEKDVENIEITDKIPEGTTFVSIEDAKIEDEVVAKGTTVGQANAEIGVKWVVTIPAGETVKAKFTVKVIATEGIISNVAIANGQESKDPTNDEDEGNETKASIINANKSSVITRDGQEVEIAKVGDLITYTITVENTGDAEGTTYIADKVPTGTEFVSTPEDEDVIVSEAKDSIVWSITLGAKGSGTEKVEKQFTVRVKEVNGAIINIAEVGGVETAPDITETAGVTSKKEVIDIERNGESIGITSEVKDKDVIKYKITVTNNGSTKLTGIEVNDKLAGIVLDGQKVNKITIKELAAGASREINAEYTVTYNTDIYKNEARLVKNEVEVTAKTDGENPEDVKDDDKTETEVEKVSLIDVKKEVAGIKAVGTDEYKLNTTNTTVRPGDIIKYTITVENTGNTVLENIKVTEHLDVNVGSETGNSEISDIKELKPGQKETIDVYYTVTSTDVNVTEQTFINNKVEVSGTTKTDPENPDEKPEKVEDDYTDNTVEVNPDVDIPVLKVWNDNDDKHQIRPQSITFNLLANDVKVATSESVSGTSYVFENFKKYDENKQPITYTVTENAVGGYESKVEPNTKTGGYTVTNTDKIRQEKTSVITRDGVKVTDKVAKVGDIIEYTITVYNDSSTNAIVTVTDPLPAGVELVDFTTTSSTLKWENKEVPANDKVEITFKVKVTSIDNGTIANTAKVGNTKTNPDQVKVEAYIVFEENGGTEVSDITGIAGEKITNTTMPTTTTKTGYTLEGWYAEESLTTKVDTLPATYPAGTTTYYAKWVPATDTKYIVNHHLEDLNADTYTKVATDDDMEGTTGEQTAAVAKEYKGFTAPTVITQKEIAADGSTVVDIYYTRNSYTITYKIEGQYFVNDKYAEKTYEYEAPVTAEADPVQAGYKFSGWATVPATMPANDVTVVGSFTTRDDTKYIVNHHLEDLNADTYTKVATDDDMEGTTGEQTAAVAKEYKGFTAPEVITQKEIEADGTTEVDIYYTRNSYTITYKIEGQYFVNNKYAEKSYEYEAPVTAEAEPVQAGYKFSGWATVPATMPANDITVVGSFTTRDDTKYIVNHHLEDLNADTYTKVYTDNMKGVTGEQTAAVAKEYKGFTAPEVITQKEIEADGTTEVDIYYTRNSYTITYKIEGQYFVNNKYAEKSYEYEAPVTAEAEPVQAGYRFSGWATVPETMPANDVTVVGSYTTRDDTKYTVEYYYEINGNYPSSTKLYDEREGTTGALVTVTADDKKPTKEGYIFDDKYTGNVLEDTIKPDGNLVLKVYFKQQLKVVYTKGSQGTFANQEYTVKYGDTPTAFNGTPTGNAGFYFVGWDEDITAPVKEDTTYTAIWEGLQVTKTRLAIVDKDNLGNTDYVDQDGDIIRYTITVKNIGDIKAENIVLKDSLAVKVVSVVIAGTEVEIANRGSNDFAANTDLLQGLTAEIEPNKTIVVTVEHTVTDAELEAALDADSKIVNTATAVLNENPYTGTDKTTDPEDGTEEEGTEVKQRCEYRIEYYYNGQLGTAELLGIAEDDVIESAARLGDSIAIEPSGERYGYTYLGYYIGIDGEVNGSRKLVEGENVIKVHYGKAVTTIEKTGSATVDAGANIEYTLTVTNTGYVGTTVTVSDELVGTTYVAGSANIGEPTITNKVVGEETHQVLTWQVAIGAASAGTAEATQTITFKATAPKDAFGETIANTAHIKDGETTIDSSDEFQTAVNEITVKYREWEEGQKGTDLNIIFVLDNSSSMNETATGSYTYGANNTNVPVAPADESKTRLYNAKEAIKSFIANQTTNNPTTSMSVITFNTSGTPSTTTSLRTLMDIENPTLRSEIQWAGIIPYRQYYITINNVEYEVDLDVTGTDEKTHYGVYLPVNYGPRLVGTTLTLENQTALNNTQLSTAVGNISISSERSGFGTNVIPALNMVSDYFVKDKKNVVIVLADGDFNDGDFNGYGTNDSGTGYLDVKEDLKKVDPNMAIYCVGFGNYNEDNMKNLSTNGQCLSAIVSEDDEEDLATKILKQFNAILASAKGEEESDETEKGEVTLKEASLDIIVRDDCPIEATYNVPKLDENGDPVLDDEGNLTYEVKTLFKCTSSDPMVLATYGLTITDKKTITWDVKEFLAHNLDATVPNTVYIKYYVPRTTTSTDSSAETGTDANS